MEKTMHDFERTIEGQLTSADSRNQLAMIYLNETDAVQTLLDEPPVSAIDYINRYTYWAQQIAGLAAETQYNIAHQLLRAYAVHAATKIDNLTDWQAFCPDLPAAWFTEQRRIKGRCDAASA